MDMEKVGSEGLQDTNLGDIQGLIDTAPEYLTEDHLLEMHASELVLEYKEEDIEHCVQGLY